MFKRCVLAWLLASAAIPSTVVAQDSSESDPFLRYPDVCVTKIVFSFAGDLWLQDGNEKQARRLTSNAGPEYYPKFSPDCSKIAFTGRIDGDDQVYVMPTSGGEARRLTGTPGRKELSARWGSDNQVVGWSPNGNSVLFRSMRDAAMISQSNLYTVRLSDKLVEPVGMARAGMGVFSPDGKQVLYSPWSRDFRTWKQYRGGWAQDLWLFDRATGATRQLTKTDATERDPMWTPAGIFFLSDRNGRMNLFREDPASGVAAQLTNHSDDAMWASADERGNIVYEVRGRIWRFDPETRSAVQQHIEVPSDDVQARPQSVARAGSVESFAPTADGKSALVVARGDLFKVGVGDGPVESMTATSDAHEREAAMSSDGNWIAFISDKGGEEELWIQPTEGGAARQVTKGNRNRFSRPLWAPNDKQIAMSGKDGAIYLVDVSTGRSREIGRSGSVFINDYAWSPDSRYLAYTRFGSTNMGQIQILDLASGRTIAASDPLYNTAQPTFSADGNYLYVLTDREFSARFSGREWNFQIPRQRSIAVLPLRRGLPDPFGPDFDPRSMKPLLAIEADDLWVRYLRTPVPSGDIDGYSVNEQDIIYVTAALGAGDETYEMRAYSFEKKETRVLDTRVNSYAFRPWSRTVALRKGKDYALLNTSDSKSRSFDVTRTAGVVKPRTEWRAIFDEVCRRYRDFFYDSDMHGYDWTAICADYRNELPRIGSRGDLTELIGRMVAELNVGHAYIDGRDELQPAAPATAALGAALSFDPARERWRIARIYRGDPIDPQYRSPLDALGSSVREGDWLQAIDGRALDSRFDPFDALAGKAEREVTLTITRDGENVPRTVIVKPVESQEGLIYRDWSERNRQLVDKLSGGRIGYVHIPAMSPRGIAEFARGYFGQIRKDGMVIDIRGNLGGSGSPLILDRLVRPFLTTGQIKGIDYPTTYPWGGFSEVFTGNLSLLVNEATMSDGDTMAYEWRKAKIGPIYGKRTWGGTIGTGSTGPLLDGTQTNVPQYALAGTDGGWIVEGHGVDPDVEVSFDASATLGGEDPQLVEVTRQMLSQISGQPGVLPKGASGPRKVPSGTK